MKTAKFTLMFLACAAATSALAQENLPQCGSANFNQTQNAFTIANSPAGAVNQQCFITVVSKQEWTGGMPNPTTSRFIEGNYEVELSGGGGGGGGATPTVGAGDGDSAIPIKRTRYLSPGVYRMTIGAAGQGGQSCQSSRSGARGGDGAPTSMSAANSGQTVLGFANAESWDRNTAQSNRFAASGRGRGDDTAGRGSMVRTGMSGQYGGGGRGADGNGRCEMAGQGGNGFIRLALTDTVVQVQPEPTRAVGQAPVMAPATESVAPPPPAEMRPARIDRN